MKYFSTQKLFFLLTVFFLFSCNSEFKDFLNNIKDSKNQDELFKVINSVHRQFLDDDNIKELVKEKLEKFNINEGPEIEKYAELLNSPIYFNVIVIPDLSNRIVNIPNQKDYDLKLIETIYGQLEEYKKVNFRNENLDIFKIDLTQETQATGSPISLNFKNLKKETFEEHKNLLKNGLGKLYSNAIAKNIQGNDFRLYFQNHLNSTKLKKSSIDEIWLNKIVIITDGYLEPGNQPTYTDINKPADKNPIPSIGKKFNEYNLDILISEVHLREGDGTKNENLKSYWYNWFKEMGIDNIDETDWWIQHDNTGNIENSKSVIGEFFKYKKKRVIDKSASEIAVTPIPKKDTHKAKPQIIEIVKEPKGKELLDTDGDGIADNIDKCPDEKGSIENFGCKKVVEKLPKKVEVHTKVIEKPTPKIRTKTTTKEKPIKKKTTQIKNESNNGFINGKSVEPIINLNNE
jgi:hypothetical protein